MKQEDKELLLTDLCARLPYKVYVLQNNGIISILDACPSELNSMTVFKLIWDNKGYWNCCGAFITDFKPYLRPMSSMTEEEIKELSEIDMKRLIFSSRHLTWHLDGEIIDYLNKKMLDWRGLIPRGLALEAPDGMYK